MNEFITLREFCLLKDPCDHEPKRDTLACGLIYGPPPFAANRGWSMGRNMVARYDVAKEAWERFGDEGPPPGTSLYTMSNGDVVVMKGIFARDPRFFELHDPKRPNAGSIIYERSQWWVWLAPADAEVASGFRRAWVRWESVTS